MGTKNNPGAFDCYAAAEPDEPFFLVLGRDPTAAFVVRFWRFLRRKLDDAGVLETSPSKLAEASSVSIALSKWCTDHFDDKGPALEYTARLERWMTAILEAAELYEKKGPWTPPEETSLKGLRRNSCRACKYETPHQSGVAFRFCPECGSAS